MSLQESPLAGWHIAHNNWRRLHLMDRHCEAFSQTTRRAKKMRRIVAEVATEHGLSLDHLLGYDRSRKVAHARQQAYYRCRTETNNSLPAIGRFFSDRDHTTILHGIWRHAARLAGEGKLG